MLKTDLRATLHETVAFFAGSRCAAQAEYLLQKPELDNLAVVENLKDMAYWAYVFGSSELALKLTALLADEPFGGNAERWAWIQYMLALRRRIFVEAGEVASAEAVRASLQQAIEHGEPAKVELRRKALARRLDGSLLYDDTIAELERNDEAGSAYLYRFMQLHELCFLQAMGGSPRFSEAELEARIQPLVEQLAQAARS